ncbi:MAG: DUF423 domain-containing protein [Planctomycetota bacterium]
MMTPDRLFTILGCLAGATGVMAGAFGAHGLKDRLSAEMLAVFETGARYQMYHAFALIAAGWVASRWPGTLATTGGWLFVGGIVLFSGSLYALSLSGIKVLGAITPLGGLMLMAGWVCLALAAFKSA